jgi:hypothetical protein
LTLLEHTNAREISRDVDELTFSAAEEDVADISRTLVGAGLGITALVPEQLSLESLFFELTEGETPAEVAA